MQDKTHHTNQYQQRRYLEQVYVEHIIKWQDVQQDFYVSLKMSAVS